MRDIVTTAIDIFEIVLSADVGLLDAPIDIAVLSTFWIKSITIESTLSFLGLMCLDATILATVTYKIAVGKALFPDKQTPTALINATSFSIIESTVSPSTQRAIKACEAARPVPAMSASGDDVN